MIIKIVNKSNNELPEYSTEQSAGVDLRASILKKINLKPLERTMVPTGLFIELPDGYEAQIRPRSGLAIKKGITVLNTPGTIDADYRGEIMVIIINLSNKNAEINNGDRICQMVINRHEKASFTEVKVINKTKRGKGGFGHTGSK